MFYVDNSTGKHEIKQLISKMNPTEAQDYYKSLGFERHYKVFFNLAMKYDLLADLKPFLKGIQPQLVSKQ